MAGLPLMKLIQWLGIVCFNCHREDTTSVVFSRKYHICIYEAITSYGAGFTVLCKEITA